MNSDITKRIFEIAEQIPDDYNVITLEDLKDIDNGVTRYRLENGYATSRSLLNNNHVSIAVTSIPDGGKFPEHVHRSPVQKEMLIVLEGKLKMNINKRSKTFKEGSLIVINQNVKHDATAIGNSVLVALTIPRDEGFPE